MRIATFDPKGTRQWRLLVLLSAVVLAPTTALLMVAMNAAGSSPLDLAVIGAAALVLHCAVFLTARSAVAAFAVASTAMLVLAFVPVPGWSSGILLPSALCFLLVLWRVVFDAPTPWPWIALAVALAGIAVAEAIGASRADGELPPWMQTFEATLLIAVATVTWGVAWTARMQNERAAADAQAALDRARRTERAHIRRDLHDVIAHSITLMVAQAEAARVGTGEAHTDESLAQLAESGRSALRGLRGMLRVLDASPPGASDVVPGIDALDDLVAGATTPLHHVSLTENGTRRPLAADTEVALVRLVQEGITNAFRHLEAPVSVEVTVDWHLDHVTVQVSDDGGRGPLRTGPPGTGLTGISERVAAAGGSFDITTGPSWTLTTRFPVLDSP